MGHLAFACGGGWEREGGIVQKVEILNQRSRIVQTKWKESPTCTGGDGPYSLYVCSATSYDQTGQKSNIFRSSS